MRRQERLAAAGDAERALQLGADGEDRASPVHRERERVRRVAARAADRERGAHDRVLAAAMDRPVVAEERVGDPAEPVGGLGVVDRDRLVRPVAARHHERAADVREQQMVERGVGEHHAEPGVARGDRFGDRGVGATAQEHDRPPGRAEQLGLRLVDLGERPGLVRHHRERLVLAVLARAEPRHRLLVRRVAGEVPAAEALHRQDRAVPQQLHRLLERASTAPGRRRGSRSARRGSDGRRDPRTRGGSRRRGRSRPSSCSAGRTGPSGRS